MTNIFISYNRQSEVIVRTLADDIAALGHTVWFDQELTGGQTWWDQILAKVRDCHVFVFVLDSQALNSTACKREYGYAADLGKAILPVLAAEGMSANLLPPTLSQIQFVDYRKQDRAAALRLARSLTTVPPPKPLPDPLPLPPEVPISYLGRLAEQIEATSILNYENQSALVVDLKRSLRDPETTEDALALLGRLRKRRDLLATIAEEIDELLVGKQQKTFSVVEFRDEKKREKAEGGPSSRSFPMKMYNLMLSNFSSKSRIVIYEKGLNVEMVGPPGGLGSSDYKKVNPLGKVPALDIGGGQLIAESEVVNEYLEEMFPDKPMLPEHPRDRAQVRKLTRFHDLYLEPPLRAMLPKLFGQKLDDKFLEEKVAEVNTRIDQLEAMIGSPWAVGNMFTLADAALAPTIFFMVNFLPALDSKAPTEGRPKLAAWWERVQKQPSVKKVLGEQQAALNVMMKK